MDDCNTEAYSDDLSRDVIFTQVGADKDYHGYYCGNPIIPDDKTTKRRRHPKSHLDHQVGGEHYKGFKIQPVKFIHDNDIPFIEGNIIKYVCRHRTKLGRQDLEKAKHYLEMLIELEYGR